MIRRFLCWLFGPCALLGCPCAMVYGDRRCHIKATRDDDQMPPLLDEPSGPGWLGALMLGALAAAVAAVVWGCR